MQVEQFLEKSRLRFPDKTALVCGSSRLTYAEIDRAANRLANALLAHGIKRRDRVVICLDNCFEAVISLFAVLKVGAVFVPVDYTIKPEKMGYVLEDCGAAALVTYSDIFERFCEVREPPPGLQASYLKGSGKIVPADAFKQVFLLGPILETSAFSDCAPAKRSIDVDLAALLYTSGTSGQPKGVMLTHLNMVSASESVISYLENISDDIILNVLRVSYSYGLYQVLTAFFVGGTVILAPPPRYPNMLLELIVEERVTALPLVPPIAAMLLASDLTKQDLSSLRYITCAGAALPLQHARKLRELLPHVKIFVMYGQTECKRISYLPPVQLDHKPGSVGIAIPNEEVFVVDDTGRAVGPGVVGELVVRGSHVMSGYWGMPAETARSLRSGPLPGEKVLYTGDLFTMDQDGFLYFVSRKDDIIKTRGEKVSPKEIENVLYSLEGILEVAVVGVPDEMLGQSIKTVITLRDGYSISRQDVLRHCARFLEDFKLPRQIEFRDSLPRNERGKVELSKLRVAAEAEA